jgi:hypothetical protein
MRNVFTLVIFATAFVLSVGCDSGSSSYTPSSSYSSSSDSQVMSQSDVDFTVDHMVGQGADRAEAQAFVDALNDAQREYEAGN